jgi:L-fuconolactonase
MLGYLFVSYYDIRYHNMGFATTKCGLRGVMMEDERPDSTRRALLLAMTAASVGAIAIETAAAERHPPIIDTHVHLFDPNRPQGAPYIGPAGTLSNSRGAFPDRYAALMRPLGVVGAVAIEASPWIEDNLWLAQTCGENDMMVGMVGNLRPEAAEFPEYLARFALNPLFRGIRYGNLWNYDLAGQSTNSRFLGELRRLGAADRVLDTANPNIDLLQAVLRVSDGAPDLRIVIDHLPHLDAANSDRSRYDAALREMQSRPNIFAKLSSVIHRMGDQTSSELKDHRARLDQLTETFGENRVLFGSDWPNSDGTATVDQVVNLMREYFSNKSPVAAEKFFWRNSLRVYKWIKRTTDQPAA